MLARLLGYYIIVWRPYKSIKLYKNGIENNVITITDGTILLYCQCHKEIMTVTSTSKNMTVYRTDTNLVNYK